MSSSCDILRFSLAAHVDSALHKMNALREEHRFCDITLILESPATSAGRSVSFHGHRVVLAASSDFLRDQFLLHDKQVEMSVAAVSSVKVAKALLVSCYTGLLQVPLAELISYLTAASILQIGEVVDKCTRAVSQFLKPVVFSNKPERRLKETESQRPDRSWLCSSFDSLGEQDVVQPSTSILEDTTKEEGAVPSQAMRGVGQESSEVDNETSRDTIGDIGLLQHTMESSEDEKMYLDTLKSEQGVETTKPPSKDDVFQDLISFSSAADHVKPVNVSQKQREQIGREESQDINVHALKAEQTHDDEITLSEISNLTEAHSPKTTEDVVNTSHGDQVERLYLCRKCDKIFQHLENYAAHLKEHRQYSCLVCGEGFSQKSKLTRHIRIHPDAKPFRCPLCHDTFMQKSLLQEHLHIHTASRYTLKPAYKSGLRALRRETNDKIGQIDRLEENGGTI